MPSIGAITTEQLYRVAHRGTKLVALRRGRELGMYVGCGFPKSGTVWLCRLLSSCLGVPYPKDYLSPVAMASVIHAHWRWSPRMPPSVYIRRDGRDVMVSLYFFSARGLRDVQRPRRARELHEMFSTLYGSGYDIDDTRRNLPAFIEYQVAHPRGSEGLPWHQHVQDWWERPGVHHLSYESLLEDPIAELSSALQALTGVADQRVAELAARRWDFTATSGRAPGVEDRQSFQRKGVAGDWRLHFDAEAASVFDTLTGDALVRFGYEPDRAWVARL